MTKQERVWKLNEELGEERAAAVQQVDDAEKAENFEDFMRQQVLGRKSSYKPD